MTRLRVYIRMSSDDAFELKAQALNNDPRLKAAGVAALKFVGDKKYIVDGDFFPDLPVQEEIEASPTADTAKPDQYKKLHVFVRISQDDSYELKAQALNQDPRLKKAGIKGLRLVGDKQYIVDGEFNPTIPTSEKPPPSREVETDVSTSSPKTSLHVFIRMKREDSYKLMADHLNENPRLQEAGISDIQLVKGQKAREAVAPFPLNDREKAKPPDQVAPPPRPAPVPVTKKKRNYWGCLLAGVVLSMIGIGVVTAGFFLYNYFLPVQQAPTQTTVVVSTPSSTARPQTTPSRTPRPTQTVDIAATKASEEVMARVQQYFENGYLPSTQGELYPMDDYILELASIDAFDFGSGYDGVQNFAVWTDVYWENASPVNFPEKSGCGFAYRIQENGNGYIAILSNEQIVMDLCDDVSCRPIGTTRGTGRVQFGDPAQASLSLVVNENHAYVLVDEQFIGEYTLLTDELREPGSLLYAILSGSNREFGTRCELSNAGLWVATP
jgi:hypothetical protein